MPWLVALGLIAVIVAVVNSVFVATWTVTADNPQLAVAIRPTLETGDVVLVSRDKGKVEFGQLVRCDDPTAPGHFVIGRVYGTSGANVRIEHDVVTVNGKREPTARACDTRTIAITNPADGHELELQCLIEDTAGHEHPILRNAQYPEPTRNSIVDAGRIYLVSDNRHVHYDSRDFHQISPESCQHIVYRLWGPKGIRDSSRRFNVLF